MLELCYGDVRVARKPSLTLDEQFYCYYYVKEAPDDKRKSTYDLAHEFKGKITQSNIYRTIQRLEKEFIRNPKFREDYEKWVELNIITPKYFYQIKELPTGEVEFNSPYETVREFYTYAMAYNIKDWKERLNLASKMWEFTGKKDPKEWSRDDWYPFVATLSRGSKFSYAVAVRSVAPKLSRWKGMTTGLKTEPRKIPLIKLANFPEILKNLIEKAKEIAYQKYGERGRDEIELILNVKAGTGIRTGNRKNEREFYGTKIGEGKTYLSVINDSFIWHVFAKRGEEWDINFIPNRLRSLIVNFVRKYNFRRGDYLIQVLYPPSKANKILAKACEELNIPKLILHDFRKIYISFLVRARIPLESAIKRNVGWKDIGTAYKHYLEFEELSEEAKKQMKRWEKLF